MNIQHHDGLTFYIVLDGLGFKIAVWVFFPIARKITLFSYVDDIPFMQMISEIDI